MKIYNVQTTIRRRLSQFLIRLANRINGAEYYDFGEPIVSLQLVGKTLCVATEGKIYRMIKKNKWELISQTIK